MSRIALILLALILASSSYAKEGGSSSNGAGGSGRGYLLGKSRWQSFKDWLTHGDFKEYQAIVQRFAEKRPEAVLLACAGKSDWRYPALPSRFEKAVELSHSPEALCRKRGLLAAYGSLVMTLHWIAESDEIGTFLLEAASRNSAKIRFVMSEDLNQGPEHSRDVSDNTWFDPERGAIHWSFRRDCQAKSCFGQRSNISLVRHELVHLLLWRALGARYPREAVWHDPLHQYTPRYDNVNVWQQERTSPGAAYIEGIADAFESIGGGNFHPRLLMPGDFMNLGRAQFEGKTCYWPAEAIRLKDGEFDSGGYAASETYVASSIGTIFESSKVDPSTFSLRDDPHAWRFYHVDRMKAFIEAVIAYAPSNPRELAVALDRQTGSDLGHRWLREFFFLDYRTGLGTAREFSAVPDPGESSPWYCIDNAKKISFLTPLIRAELSRNREALWKAYGEHYSVEEVVAAIGSYVSEWQAEAARAEAETMPRARTGESLKALAKSYRACDPAASGAFDLQMKHLETELDPWLNRLGWAVSAESLGKLIRWGCEDPARDLWKGVDEHVAKAQALQDPALDRVARVKQWRELEFELRRAFEYAILDHRLVHALLERKAR
ncbi:MAG TPA: hypothetical protein VM598_14740 [Bdellovibrionota bacterium]|nr:hypothetical protein [Bdellovibrionota bacterium]